MPPFSVIVLAGGRSSRMGFPKELVFIGGQPFLARLLKLLHNISSDVIVSGEVNFNDPETKIIPDQTQNIGPLGGISSALPHCNHDWALLLPIDLFLIDLEFLNWLKVQSSTIESTTEALICQQNGQRHYLTGFIKKSCSQVIDQMIQHGNYKVGELLNKVHTRWLEAPSSFQNSLINFNAPTDLLKFGLMKITILAFGEVEEIIESNELVWMTQAKNSHELKAEILNSFSALKAINFSLAVNEVISSESLVLNENDTVALLPPFAGG